MKQCLITTVDNPFDPFDNFDSWFQFDIAKGYNSSERLMRLANVTEEMSDTEENEEIERAIDRLIELDFMNIYKKVTKELNDPTED